MYSLGLLILRLTFGGLLAGHGAQKLFGWYGGRGLEGTAGMMENLGLRPGHQWATLVGAAEFFGGLLTALGLFHPVGPLVTMAPMSVATFKVHAGKPIWVTSGGAELPVTNIAISTALLLAGPGWFSFDRIFGTRAPFWLVGLVLGDLGYGLYSIFTPSQETRQRVLETAERAVGTVRERVPGIAA
ncbi:MAG TPA: DoxX family protein [Chloroflexota bacterium]|nr:DoxX family protein [Chloroflexota bacterium]